MASVGGIQFFTLKAQLPLPGLQVEEISRAGTDGNAYRKLQSRADPVQAMGLRNCIDLADGLALYASLLAMQGTVVAVVDDYGGTFNRVMVLDVKKAGLSPLVTAGGGVVGAGTGALLAVSFTLQVLP